MFDRRFALPLATLALAAAQVNAQERSPYYIGLSQSFSHDSNVYRSTGNESSETISTTGLVLGLDQPIGRQRLYGDASANYNRYDKSSSLNNKSYSLTAGLDWETIEFLTGQLRYATRNSLADFGTLNGSSTPTDQVSQQASASARYGITSKLALDAGYEYRSLDYKNAVYASRNYTQNATHAGFRWGTAGLLTLGVGYRLTKGVTPEFSNAPPFEDKLDRRDLDFSLGWSPSGFSTLNLRLSSSHETHSLSGNAEFSGVTGELSWAYRPTGKLSLTTAWIRETGTETTFLSGAAPSGSTASPLQVDSSRISNSARLELRYSLTGKVSLNGDARQRRGKVSGTSGDDTVTSYGLGLSYAPTRAISLGCSANRESRDVSGSTAYSATMSSCSAQITLR